MADEIQLRSARPEDEELLFQLFRSARAPELAPLGWSAKQVDAFLRQQFRAQSEHYRRELPGAQFDVIELGGAPVGRFYVWRTPERVDLVDITLFAPARGKGIGTRLIQALVDQAAGANRTVRLYVEQENRARRLYTRLGFRKVDEQGIYCVMEWKRGA